MLPSESHRNVDLEVKRIVVIQGKSSDGLKAGSFDECTQPSSSNSRA